MSKTGINLAEMFEEQTKKTDNDADTNGNNSSIPIERVKISAPPSKSQQEKVSLKQPAENASKEPPTPSIAAVNYKRSSSVSNILSELPENTQLISAEQIEAVIESVYSRLVETREEKMISFRGSKTVDDFFLQLQAGLKSYANKKVSKEKLMDLILQIVMRDSTYREKIIGGVVDHLLNNK